MTALDLDAVRERREAALRWHGGVHQHLHLYAVSSADVPALLARLTETERQLTTLRAKVGNVASAATRAHEHLEASPFGPDPYADLLLQVYRAVGDGLRKVLALPGTGGL